MAHMVNRLVTYKGIEQLSTFLKDKEGIRLLLFEDLKKGTLEKLWLFDQN